ncbi:hypothetical protein GETHPA_09110 [Geothrix rubra]|uniref:Heparan-alpha-glucosaminide N-acetyltransferase catalytic domain-containing protein n=1 Tax=Geothrix rubra TaxID=2927977 RepID=A0ABQ5Q427_9BACT|nr:heparan-alpha-glucosaminide N-acetyltransferase domain-containing protein [Geothrix rubra]GLH69378.1 hypothetical protein GETHPA_09110 [Geothrix rubra]
MPAPIQGPPASAPRIHILDFARLLAILLMLQGHTMEAFVAPSAMDWGTLHWRFWGEVRGLTAPLFLLVSGAATVLATRRDREGRVSARQYLRRIRTVLLVTAIGYLLVFPAACFADLRWVSEAGWRTFLQVNILQLNGVMLLLLTGLLALTRNARTHAAWSLAVGLLILLAAPVATSLDWFSRLPEGLAAYLSFAHGSLFPLFPAGGFMLLGVGLGTVLLEAPEDQRLRWFRLAALGAGLAALALSLAAAAVPGHLLPPHDAYKAGWASSFHRLGFSLLVLGGLATVAEAWPRLVQALAPLGRKSLAVYVVHLALIYGTPWTPGLTGQPLHALSALQGIGMIPAVAAATFGLVLLWDRVRNHSEQVRTLAHLATTFVLAYALLF